MIDMAGIGKLLTSVSPGEFPNDHRVDLLGHFHIANSSIGHVNMCTACTIPVWSSSGATTIASAGRP
jgi:hypothetical protein